MSEQDRQAVYTDELPVGTDVSEQWYIESVRRLHLIVPLALLVPLFALIPIAGMDPQEAAVTDAGLMYVYLSALLLMIPAALMYLAESRIASFTPFFLICLVVIAAGMAAAYFFGRFTGLSVQGSDLPPDLMILLLFFFDALSIRYNENSRIRSKREGDLSWTQDRKLLPGPNWFVFFWFAGIYAVSLFAHSQGLGNAALAGAILYFFVLCPYLLIKGRADYLESRKHIRGVPVKRIRRLNNRRLGAMLLPAFVLAAASVMTAGGRHFLDLPSSGPADGEMINRGILGQQLMAEKLRELLEAEQGAPPPAWFVQLCAFIENALSVIAVALFVYVMIRLLMHAVSKFRGIEKEKKELRFAEGMDEHISLRAFSVRPSRYDSGIRRRYRRMILRYRGHAPGISETPSQMEERSGIPDSKEVRTLHEEYEKIRYGRV